MTPEPIGPPYTIRVTDVGETIRHHSCMRRFALGYDNQRRFRELPFAGVLYNTMDPILAEHGKQREADWALALEDLGLTQLALPEEEEGKGAPFEVFADLVAERATPGAELFAREVQISGQIGVFRLFGRIDFTLLRWPGGPDAAPELWLIECKASRRDQTYQRVQVTLYRMLVRALLEANPLMVGGHTIGPESLRIAVVRIDEATNQMISLDALRPLRQTEQLEHDVRLMLGASGPMAGALQAPLDELPYRLEGKCDACVFNIHCLSESARQRRLELLGLAPDIVRALRRAGITTLDQLAQMPRASSAAEALRLDPEFVTDLETLQLQARTRCRNLPPLPADVTPLEADGEDTERAYDVEALPHRGYGHLPVHDLYDPEQARGLTFREIKQRGLPTHRLMRVFLSVHYDYVENRVGALAAHVTSSDGELHTPFTRAPSGRYEPSPEVVELEPGAGRDGATRPLEGESIVEIKQGEWTGRYEADCAMEQALLRAFLGKLVRCVQLTAPADKAPLHFYVWSNNEITKLLEACERVGGGMLRYVRELFGCRESLEQLIYSSLEHELRSRYTTAWTGRGLTVATSLRWFGRRFHWRRVIGRRVVDLDEEMHRDLFDFRARLHVDASGQWCDPGEPDSRSALTEVRSRFYDSLSAPYWRAYWGTLPDPDSDEVAGPLKAAMRQYMRARQPGVLEGYLEARCHAMRWLEERVTHKNVKIHKAHIDLRDLPTFRLDTDSPAAAAIDYLRLDQHVKFTGWLQRLLQPPYLRVATGESLPIRDLQVTSQGGLKLMGRLDPTPYYTRLDTLQARTSIDAGKMVRLHEVKGTPQEGQDLYALLVSGKTCVIEELDWSTGLVRLSIIPSSTRNRNEYYTLPSRPFYNRPPFARATLDESITNFVDARVERRLTTTSKRPRLQGAYMQDWFDPVRPRIPAHDGVPPEQLATLRQLLRSVQLPLGDSTAPILPERVEVILRGLSTRIQLIQGPPGTGKTMVTALAVLTRVLARRTKGDIVLVTAHTHTAVDTLLRRIDKVLGAFTEACDQLGLDMPPVALGKVFSSQDQVEEMGGRVDSYVARGSYTLIQNQQEDHVVVLGATTSSMLKLTEDFNKKAAAAWKGTPDGFQAPFLVVDEASMMVFAHFFALATLLERDGELLMAGDHRQLAPIMAHDWDREDRPPAQHFRMHDSAFDAIARLRDPDEDARRVMKVRLSDAQIRRDGLETTFRLPGAIRSLIQPLYNRDQLKLRGPAHKRDPEIVPDVAPSLESIWTSGHSLYLVLHDERGSKQSNAYEAHLIRHILDAGLDAEAVDDRSVVVMTPHRAQRAQLKVMLDEYDDCVQLVDTVERMQGGEAPTVIYSATVSDPVAIAQETEFLLDIERTNVAFSRTKRRLVVLCARTLIDFVPPKLEHYETALLWKHLRTLCTTEVAGGELGVTPYHVLVPNPDRGPTP